MDLIEFTKKFPDEESCKTHFKALRDAQAKKCPHCQGTAFYWKNDKEVYECKECHYRMSLKKGTVMEHSKFTFREWYIVFHLMSSTKQAISASEMQRQLGKKYYRGVWEMMQKIRDVMGQRDGNDKLKEMVEVDEMMFSTDTEKEDDEPNKRGMGSQSQTKVLVMAESSEISPEDGDKVRRHTINKKVGHIRMKVIKDMRAATITEAATAVIDSGSGVVTDGCRSHTQFKDVFAGHEAYVEHDKREVVTKKLPWVHVVAGRCKKSIEGVHDEVKRKFLQFYLDEFCYKFNRRYFNDMFDRLLLAASSCVPVFRHGYGKSASV